MDTAKLEVDEEEATAEEAGYESMSREEEEVTWEELHERHSAALTPTSSAVPAPQHHQNQGPAPPSDLNVQVSDVQEAPYLQRILQVCEVEHQLLMVLYAIVLACQKPGTSTL